MARKASKPPEGESSAAGTTTKAEAIRRALAEGLTRHEDAAPFIKAHFGHDITPGHFAASKSREKTPGEPGTKPGRPKGKTVKVKAKRGRKPGAAAQARPAASPGADLLAEMEALKPLVESMGKEKAHRIIDLLG